MGTLCKFVNSFMVAKKSTLIAQVRHYKFSIPTNTQSSLISLDNGALLLPKIKMSHIEMVNYTEDSLYHLKTHKDSCTCNVLLYRNIGRVSLINPIEGTNEDG